MSKPTTHRPVAAAARRLMAYLLLLTGLLTLAVALASLVLTLAFICRTSDVYSAAEGDALVTGSTNYTVRDVIDDGTGMIALMLGAD